MFDPSTESFTALTENCHFVKQHKWCCHASPTYVHQIFLLKQHFIFTSVCLATGDSFCHLLELSFLFWFRLLFISVSLSKWRYLSATWQFIASATPCALPFFSGNASNRFLLFRSLQVSSWGGYVFLINLIPLHVLALIFTGRFSHRIYVAYSTVSSSRKKKYLDLAFCGGFSVHFLRSLCNVNEFWPNIWSW